MKCAECGKEMEQGDDLLDGDTQERYCLECADFQGYYGQLTRLQTALGVIALIALILVLVIPILTAIF
jgi:hypothetical protein